MWKEHLWNSPKLSKKPLMSLNTLQKYPRISGSLWNSLKISYNFPKLPKTLQKSLKTLKRLSKNLQKSLKLSITYWISMGCPKNHQKMSKCHQKNLQKSLKISKKSLDVSETRRNSLKYLGSLWKLSKNIHEYPKLSKTPWKSQKNAPKLSKSTKKTLTSYETLKFLITVPKLSNSQTL